MDDELASAIKRIIFPALKPEGFLRARKRDLIRIENGVAQRLYFQVSSSGSRYFCVSACVNLIAGNPFVALQPGFRLTRDTDGGDLWLPSSTAEQAEQSAKVILGSIRAEALPYFEKARTVEGMSRLLAREQWGSTHHLSFQRGLAAALEGNASSARRHLSDAIELYKADGRAWCADYIDRAAELQASLAAGTAQTLLTSWEQANRRAHGAH